MNTLNPVHAGTRQRGVVLVIALLMLLVLTLIALAATRSTALEERMTANQNDREVAFEAAEAALRYGEGSLSAASQPNYTANTAGAYYQPTIGSTSWSTITWGGTATATYGGGILPTPSQPPDYFVVETTSATASPGSSLSTDQQQQMQTVFFVYAKGWGTSGNTSVVLESAYRE